MRVSGVLEIEDKLTWRKRLCGIRPCPKRTEACHALPKIASRVIFQTRGRDLTFVQGRRVSSSTNKRGHSTRILCSEVEDAVRVFSISASSSGFLIVTFKGFLKARR